MEEENDQSRGDTYIYALRDEDAFLQTGEDEKPEINAEPPHDPAWYKCWFCWKRDRKVLWAAKYPVRDPNTFAVIAEVFICDECVARFAEPHVQKSPLVPPPQ